jgi:carbon-monoxide dehydrogenase large subunit
MIGQAVKRSEDRRLVTGEGRYVDDLRWPGLTHAVIVRSPHAHARIMVIETAKATELPGVLGVFRGAELSEIRGGVPPLIPAPLLRTHRHPVIAVDRVRHVGEPVAVVVAEDPYRAQDGAESLVVEYDVLAAASDPAAALAADAPRVYDDWPDNNAGTSERRLGPSRPLEGASTIVEMGLALARVAGMPIEPRAVMAWDDPTTNTLTVWSTTQVPFDVRGAIAANLGLDEARVRVLAAKDIGGGFGVKGHVYPEDILIPAVARRLGRPVKWVEVRREHFVAAAHDRDQRHRARLGVRADGTIVGVETHFTRDHGAYPTLGDAITINSMNNMVGPYRIPAYVGDGLNVVTHKTFAAAYRGAGRPEAAFVIERLLDRAARTLKIDPAELRRRNLIRPDEMPYRTGFLYRDGFPIVYDVADYPASFERLLTLFGYDKWRARQQEVRSQSHRLGVGLATYVEATGLGPYEGAEVCVEPSGKIVVSVAVATQGQSHETTLAQICASTFGVSLDDVAVVTGDTARVGLSVGTIASRVAAVVGPAVAKASAEVAEKAYQVAAERLECAPEDLVLDHGRLHVVGAPHRGLSLGEVARAALRSHVLARQESPGLSSCAFHYTDTVTWGFGANAVAVEIDLDTCQIRILSYAAVHDCGRPINPSVVEGQLHGGITQGIGAALTEALVYDRDGQLLTTTLMDYGLPTAADVPCFVTALLEYPSAKNPLGIKGVGEGGIIAPAAAIANAVEDALADLDVEITEIPITGPRLFAALADARRRAESAERQAHVRARLGGGRA